MTTRIDTDLATSKNATPASTTTAAGTDWRLLLVVMLLIVLIREGCVWLMAQFGYANLGNLVGLFLLLGLALVYRHMSGRIPTRLVAANAMILKESLFAFLPICAGTGLLILHLGQEGVRILAIMTVCTLFSLWLYARLAKRWL